MLSNMIFWGSATSIVVAMSYAESWFLSEGIGHHIPKGQAWHLAPGSLRGSEDRIKLMQQMRAGEDAGNQKPFLQSRANWPNMQPDVDGQTYRLATVGLTGDQ